MQFKQFRSIRVFIFLLLTIFLTDTVYASGMMVVDQLCANDTEVSHTHHHDSHDKTQVDHHQHDEDQKQSTNDQCSKCGHCLACFTILPPSQIEKMQSQIQAATLSLFEPSYLSHINAQPQRPPIS